MSISPWAFSTGGGMSVVECLPVVQGGIVMNSSKVRTRGLQHFHPSKVSEIHIRNFRNVGNRLR